MNNLKFRVWDKVDYMSNPFTLYDVQNKKIQFTTDCPVMQFTGLKDRKGIDIYEGDIVVIQENYPLDNSICVIEHKDISWYYKDISNNKYESIEGMLGCGEITDEYAEIIGNIYQNPELLK